MRPDSSSGSAPSPGQQAVVDMPRFETIEEAVAEDRRRLALLEMMTPIEPPMGWTKMGLVLARAKYRLRYFLPGVTAPRLNRQDCLALQAKLRAIIDDPTAVTTLASSVAMRSVRIDVIGALLDALEDYPDEELRTVTVTKGAWVLTPEQLAATDAANIKEQFEQDLARTGTTGMPGPLVGFLHGEFEPTNCVFVIHFHIATTRAKADHLAEALGALPKAYKANVALKRPIRKSKVRSRAWQITYLLKSLWPQRAVRFVDGKWKRDRKYQRVREPFASHYLVWLDQHRLHDLMVTNGTWSRKKGGSAAWRQFSLKAEGVGKTTGSAS